MKSLICIFDFDVCTIISDYLDITDLVKIASSLEHIPSSFTGLCPLAPTAGKNKKGSCYL